METRLLIINEIFGLSGWSYIHADPPNARRWILLHVILSDRLPKASHGELMSRRSSGVGLVRCGTWNRVCRSGKLWRSGLTVKHFFLFFIFYIITSYIESRQSVLHWWTFMRVPFRSSFLNHTHTCLSHILLCAEPSQVENFDKRA